MTDNNQPEDNNDFLNELEKDYIASVKENTSETIEDFIESFLYNSWEYNEQKIKKIQTVFSRYSSGELSKETVSSSFNRMLNCLEQKLKELDKDKNYPIIHTGKGASLIVSLVDGLIVQYFLGVYTIDRLQDLTPQLKKSF
ncbi:MAG: hypothetical protein JJU16_11555 [Alkalibacterium sp.]|nr:hypothetical protein [Alkalibacterium sp.]